MKTPSLRFALALLVLGLGLAARPVRLTAAREGQPESLWMEAETFGPLKGSNFSFMPPEKGTRGSWSIAGPDAAPAFTQGGESEFMSIAARADEPGEVTARREVEVPVAGEYRLWVRYADYGEKEEAFGVRIRQGSHRFQHVFGRRAVIDE